MMPFIEIETIMSMIVHKDIKKKKKKREIIKNIIKPATVATGSTRKKRDKLTDS